MPEPHTDLLPYEHSGAIGIGGPLFLVLTGAATGALSLGYGYLNVFLGSLRLALPLAYGVLLILVIRGAAKLSHVRSPRFLELSGVVVGLCALYTSWVAFRAVVVHTFAGATVYADFLLQPRDLADFVVQVSSRGWFGLKGYPPQTTWELWIPWALEAVFLLGGAMYGSKLSIADFVYCESCRRWCRASGLRLTRPEDSALVLLLLRGDPDLWERWPRATAESQSYVEVELKTCPTCDQTGTLTVALVNEWAGPDQQSQANRYFLSPMLQIPPEHVARFQALASPAK